MAGLRLIVILLATYAVFTSAEERFSIDDLPSHEPKTYFDILNLSRQRIIDVDKLSRDKGAQDYIKDLVMNISMLPNFALETSQSPLMSLTAKDILQALTPQGSPLCANDTARVLVGASQGMKEFWALQMIDASAKPGAGMLQGRFTWIGDYGECLAIRGPPSYPGNPPIAGRYFNLVVYLTKPPFNHVQVNWGLCLPNSCSEQDVYLLSSETFRRFKISALAGQPTIMDNKTEATTATHASIAVLIIIGFFMLVGTLYDVFSVQLPKWNKEKAKSRASSKSLPTNRIPDESNGYTAAHGYTNGHANGHSNGYGATTDSLPSWAIPNGQEEEKQLLVPRSTKVDSQPGKLSQALLAFSVYTNGSKLLGTKQSGDALGAIHGIRFLSMSWVLMAHMFAFGFQNVINPADFSDLLKRWTMDVISNGFPSVDSFFTLSGLLTSYLTIKELLKRNTLKINWGLFYFHRFWRLTPPYMLTLLLALGLQQYLGSGAIWTPTQPSDKENCETHWWTNLLYINNLVDDKYMCFGHSWYLSNDMQFFVISPLLMVPFFFGTVHGVVACIIGLAAHFLATGLVSNHYGLPPTTTVLGNAAVERESQDYMWLYYMKPWCRIGPYIVGLMAGGLLARNAIRLNKLRAMVGWALMTATGLAVVYGLHEIIDGERSFTQAESDLYNTLSRAAWGAAVSWVVVACKLGYGGPVNKLLSWSPFVVLGRLTYMAYLVHPTLIYAYYGNQDQLFYLKDYNVIIMILGILVLANLTAFALSLCLEAPWIGLEKALLPSRRR